ncbi:MAG: 30S ribosomal protein S13, partial [Candidatus Nanopelagicales bacterium]
MARLIGVDLPREKRLAIALTYVYGVGRSQAAKALEATGIDPQM